MVGRDEGGTETEKYCIAKNIFMSVVCLLFFMSFQMTTIKSGSGLTGDHDCLGVAVLEEGDVSAGDEAGVQPRGRHGG